MRLQLTRALAAATIVAGSATAQTGSISGVVTDRATRRPVEGVSVAIRGIPTGAQTKANGSYTLLGVQPGVYTLEARRIGYQTVEVTGVVVNADARRVQDFELTVSGAVGGRPGTQPPPGPLIEPGVVGGRPPAAPPVVGGVAVVEPGGIHPPNPRLDPVRPIVEPGHVGPPPSMAIPPRPAEAGGLSFEHLLFPPELVMQHQRALELTAEQRRTITEAVKALQNQTIDLQWNLQAEQQALMTMLEKRPINEAAAVQQMAKLVDLEDAVKRTHLATLIKIKNALTDKQIGILSSVRRDYPTEYPPPPARRDPFHELYDQRQ